MRGNTLIELLEKSNAIWRSYMMYKETMGFVKGIGAGIVASVAVAAVGSQMMKKNRHLRRDAHRAMHADVYKRQHMRRGKTKESHTRKLPQNVSFRHSFPFFHLF